MGSAPSTSGVVTGRAWPPESANDHINLLELKAVGQALGQLQQVVSGKSVLVSSDNTTVVAYLNKQGGTHSVPLCLGDQETSAVVPTVCDFAEGQAHRWQGEHPRGLSVQRTQGRPHRVEVVSRGSQCGDSQMGRPVAGSVCNLPEQSAAVVRLPSSGRMGDRRNVLRVESGGRVRVSTVCSHSVGTTQSSAVGLQGHSHCTLLADEELVHQSIGSAGGVSGGITVDAVPVVSTRRSDSSPRRAVPTPSRLEVIGDLIRKDGFSAEAAKAITQARRPSTSACYEAKWKLWCDWCMQRKIDFCKPSMGQVGDFLLHLFHDKGLSVSTIKGFTDLRCPVRYVSAIIRPRTSGPIRASRIW